MPYKGFVKHTDRNGNGINGRPPNYEREAWMDRLGITREHPVRDIPTSLLDQLRNCRSDEARRLIMGVSK